MLDEDLQAKYDHLKDCIAQLGSCAVAFSGGVDSTLLLFAAHEALGDNALAVTGVSPSVPQREVDEAKAFCAEHSIKHVLVETHEYDIEGFDHNPADRCYHCKKELFRCVGAEAARLGFAHIAEGSNLDDLGDYRPGFAAIDELGVASPLREAQLAKADIRAISKGLGLPTWNKQSFACLNSRFEYGDLITEQKLSMVDAAEEALMALGFTQVRVRMSGTTARIEVMPKDIERVASPEVRDAIVPKLKELGFRYVALDLQGYRSGSMNEGLEA